VCHSESLYDWIAPSGTRQPVASYFGSADRGLGFYHIDLPELETTRWLNINNCGMVVIRKCEISMSELEKELSEIFCKEWPVAGEGVDSL
jgi:hypothetical protein